MDVNTLNIDSNSEEELKDLLATVAMLRGYLNDHIIRDLGEIMASLSKLAGALASTDLVNILERATQDPELDKALMDPPKIGITSLFGVMGEDDVKRGMGIMIALLRSMGKAASIIESD